jgi:tetratricopeptide (TPR) repeat protein
MAPRLYLFCPRQTPRSNRLLCIVNGGGVTTQRGLIALARSAFERRDFPQSVELWAEVRSRYTEMPDGYSGGIQALRVAGRLSEAEAVLLEAKRRFPGSVGIAIEHCLVALARQDVDASEERISHLQMHHPEAAEGYLFATTFLRRQQRFDEAEAQALVGMQQFPSSVLLFCEFAWIAFNRGDWAAAIHRWEAVRTRFPDAPDGYFGGTRTLIRTGAFEAAEVLITAGFARFPENLNILIQWATLALRRGNLAEGERRWKIAQSKYPVDVEVKRGLGETQMLRQLEGIDQTGKQTAAARPQAMAPVGKTQAETDHAIPERKDFFLQFEGLGSNCEFGLVQRLTGVEPLGLLRWATITVDHLVACLEARFEGVGAPENTRLNVTHTGEYALSDTRYFSMHTFIREGQMPPDKLYTQMCRRLVFLKNKLLADLKACEKILVYKMPHGLLRDDDAFRIHDALNLYPGNILLCVGKPRRPEQNHTVNRIRDGLFVGYISELEADPQFVRHHLDAWVEICRQTYRAANINAISPAVPSEEMAGQPAYEQALDYTQREARQASSAEAVALWAKLRAAYPNEPDGYRHGLSALRASDALEEAEVVAIEAVQRFPTNLDVLIEYARVAFDRRDLPKALDRWALVREISPTAPVGYTAAAQSLRLSHRLAEASAMAEQAKTLFPHEAEAWIEHGRAAAAARDWPEALQRWILMRAAFPYEAQAWAGNIAALTELRRYSEADDLFAILPQALVSNAEVLIQHARAATQRRDWSEALTRWERATRLHPGATAIKDGLNSARVGYQLAQVDAGHTVDTTSSLSVESESDSKDVRQLLQGFESLGGNCEFGMVQGMADVHTLGLLRWCSIRPGQLATMISAGFEGVGLPQNTAVQLDEKSQEYMLRDKRYFAMHTFIRKDQTEPEKLFIQMCRRLVFLKNKMVADLKLGEKVFVYKTPDGRIDDAEITAIWQAMQSYGRSTLLCVRLYDEQHKPGSVDQLMPGAFVGYLDRLPATLIRSEISFNCWVTICQQLAEMLSWEIEPVLAPAVAKV